MARFMKKTVAFVLVLTTIFLFSTAAFAEYAQETDFPYGPYEIDKFLSSDNEIITASMNVQPDDGYNNVEATIIVSWVHCPEDEIHPRNYITESDTYTFNLEELGGNVGVTIDELPAGHVIISVTASYKLKLFEDPAPLGSLTIYPY